MHTSSHSNVEKPGHGPWNYSKGSCRGRWSAPNIAAMVLGFVFFWPVGMVVLFWILSGRHVKDLPNAIHSQWNAMFGRENGDSDSDSSENSVFNAFQQTQYDRISEIKEEIKMRARRFKDFRSNAKRRADEAEFSQFMADKPSNDEK